MTADFQSRNLMSPIQVRHDANSKTTSQLLPLSDEPAANQTQTPHHKVAHNQNQILC